MALLRHENEVEKEEIEVEEEEEETEEEKLVTCNRQREQRLEYKKTKCWYYKRQVALTYPSVRITTALMVFILLSMAQFLETSRRLATTPSI